MYLTMHVNLPGSAAEAREISDILRSTGVDVMGIEGSDATEARIRNEILDRRIVHLATHGFHMREGLGFSYQITPSPHMNQTTCACLTQSLD